MYTLFSENFTTFRIDVFDVICIIIVKQEWPLI